MNSLTGFMRYAWNIFLPLLIILSAYVSLISIRIAEKHKPGEVIDTEKADRWQYNGSY